MGASIRCAILLAVAALCGGCFGWAAPVRPPVGFLFTHYSAPLTANATDFKVEGIKGSSHTFALREPFVTGQGVAWAQAAVEEAARQGGLKKVYYADYEVLNVLSIYGRFTVRVYGE